MHENNFSFLYKQLHSGYFDLEQHININPVRLGK